MTSRVQHSGYRAVGPSSNSDPLTSQAPFRRPRLNRIPEGPILHYAEQSPTFARRFNAVPGACCSPATISTSLDLSPSERPLQAAKQPTHPSSSPSRHRTRQPGTPRQASPLKADFDQVSSSHPCQLQGCTGSQSRPTKVACVHPRPSPSLAWRSRRRLFGRLVEIEISAP